jgi:hypothetical protein
MIGENFIAIGERLRVGSGPKDCKDLYESLEVGYIAGNRQKIDTPFIIHVLLEGAFPAHQSLTILLGCTGHRGPGDCYQSGKAEKAK